MMAITGFEITTAILIAYGISQNIEKPTAGIIVSQQQPTPSFSIYCTSNLDATGACNRVDNNQPVACEMVPGGVINCKQPGEPAIQCVIYSGVIGTQAYFYCTRRTDPGVRDTRINGQRFAPAQTDPTLNKVLTPLPNAYPTPQDPGSTFSNPIKDVFN